jgi:microsomal dipeptidase-like Zn-dependent dipeptidase/gamma-glutamyl-gamma-aminobutyrate hydrolase PuuD
MNRYNLNQRLSDLYANDFANKGHQPVIGITGNYGELTCKLGEGYYKSIVKAGGTPLITPPVADEETILSVLNRIDALLLSGGADINPLYAGEEPSAQLGGINAERDLPELLITRLAANRQMPILGICRGIQTMAMALGGHVAQHISTSVKHSQDADRSEPTHTVALKEGSLLSSVFSRSCPVGCDSVASVSALPASSLPVNSFHHQAVDATGPHFRVAATAPDGTIEAIESSEHKPFIGVQWHPECMGEDQKPLFDWLVCEARAYHEAQQLHDRILTLDTHCDTPMFFPQNVDFSTRDSKILVDLPKMSEGRLDATIMVCYLPQPKEGETFRQIAPFDVAGPKAYADLIFDKITEIVDHNSEHVALARTPDELWQNKRAGKKSIMLGIENGLALEGELRNVSYFQKRGVVYITLCHNGDNDICDSARGSQTHGGVSAFGEKVIRQMNESGLMVDLSHGAESSFYDALQISKKPIVCSHSSARALCDHPRNLTDEQMRALAQQGGVCQITLYNGFLVKDGEASVLDAMAHLDHAIQVMGIDHVGLGTDFDGDGGVSGLADAAELTLFTRQLLARRYSEADIQKIWGGNFLRVMRECQTVSPPLES